MPLAIPDHPDWRAYERQIEEQLRRIAPSATITFDAKLPGRYSGTDRQVDVLVEGEFKGYGPARMAVDCKLFSSNVTVTEADAFVGYMDDLDVELGLLVTTKGFSESAQRRLGAVKGLRYQIIPYGKIDEWEPPIASCQVCRQARHPDAPPGVVYLDAVPPEVAGAEFATAVGACDRCDAVHLECTCGAVTGVYEAEEGGWRECDGGCGMEFRVAPVEYDRDAIPISTNPQERVSFR